jgi:hypothetical protein
MLRSFLCFVGAILALVACNSRPDHSQQLADMEQRFAQMYTPALSDSLVNLYRQAAKENPDDHALSLRYFARAAEIQFDKRDDGVSAARWLADVIGHHGEGQDLGDAIGVYARLWNNYKYKAAETIKMDLKDIDQMQADLLANQPWIDSALVRIDRRLAAQGASLDAALTGQFVEISEAYSTLTKSPDRYADLLIKAAGAAENVGNWNKSVQLYGRVAERLPNAPQSRTALFMQGFVYENDLKDLERARTTYEEFLRRYPQDTAYADDVRMALQHLGKSPEELIKQFEKNQ